MNPLHHLFKSSDKNTTRNIAVNAIVIITLFLGIGLNFVIESKVFNSVKHHTEKTDFVIQHEKYKRVIDKTNFELAQLDNQFSNYLLSGDSQKLRTFQLQLSEVEKNIQSVKNGAAQFVPKYLVNIFVHKANNRIWYKNQILENYQTNGQSVAMNMLNSDESKHIYNEYSQGNLEIINALNSKIENLNQAIIAEKASILSLDGKWNIISLVFMLLIALLVVYKMTETNRLNDRLVYSVQKEKHAQLVKDQFMSNMTHELRTPLNSILGYTNLLSKRTHTTEIQNWIQAINASGNMLMEVVNDVLDYSKLESGYIQFSNEPFNLDTVLLNLKNIMANRADSKKLSFSVLKDNSLPVNFMGDEKKLMQILINLTGNAIKFTEKGSIKVEVISKKNLGGKLWLEFLVSDTGIGISEDNLPHIFDRFYQIETGFTKKYAGTGLGLPIVKQLIDMQGGSIVVKSKPENGTTISFMLPYDVHEGVVEKESSINLAPVKSMHQPKRKRILVVDDHELNRDLLRFLLKEYDYTVETAANGLEAIEKLKQKKFDLALMDIQMPELNGIETTKRIRTQLEMNLPIIAFTAFNQPTEKKACLEAGMDAYLAKPVNENELLRLLNFYLSEDHEEVNNSISGLVNYDQITGIAGTNKEFINQLLTKAIDLIPSELDNLYQAIINTDKNQSKEIAHHMRSTLGLVGADASIIEKVKSIEYADITVSGERQRALICFDELKKALQLVITELQQYIAA